MYEPSFISRDYDLGKLRLYPFVRFDREAWNIAARLGAQRTKRAGDMAPDIVDAKLSAGEVSLMGAAGECAVAWYFRQGTALESALCDGGADLIIDGYSVQVRCRNLVRARVDFSDARFYLKPREVLRADRCVLTAFHPDKGVTLLGWCTAQEFRSHEEPYDFAHNGPRRTIHVRHMHRMYEWKP